MIRPLLVRLVACLATGLVAVGACPVAAAPAPAQSDTPLEVSIESLSPSTLPRSGRITVTGQITNHSEEEWTDLNVYLLTSPQPMTSAAELAAAAATDPAAVIGSRLTDPGLYQPIDDLGPGDSTGFALSVPRRALEISGDTGVYWLGVHVLGASGDGFDAVADGRARTLVPLMRPRGPQATVSLLMPIKARVRRQPDGALANLDGWQELVAAEGRLGRLLGLSGTAIDVPVTWLVDPAVLDAVTSVAADNPPMSTAPTDDPETDQQSPSPGGDPTQSAEAPSDPPEDEEPAELSEEAQQAATWLGVLQQQAEQHTVLAVPYADVDVASMARRGFMDLQQQAAELSEATLTELGIDAAPVVAPPSGLLPRIALRELDPGTPVVLSERAAPDAPGPVVESARGHRVLLTRSLTEAEGRRAAARVGALELRQRILSQAAVHALSEQGDAPLVVSTPESWDPGGDWRAAQFFVGLEVPWLRAVDAPTAMSAGRGTPDEYDGTWAYPPQERRDELSIPNLLATQELVATGRTFAELLTRNDTVDQALAQSAMLASSYRARRYPNRATARARETTQRVRALMSQIRVEGPPFVTMSSEEGTFQVSVVNGLDEPVTVGVEATTPSEGLRITEPGPVSLGAGQRASIRLRARASDIGVHPVTVTPVNGNGDRLGTSAEFNVRSSQVGMVIWLIMGVGAGVLVTALGLRIYRRVRARKATHGPLLERSPR